MSTSRILFLISFFIGCGTPPQQEVIAIQWHNNKAAGIRIPKSLLKNHPNLQNRLTIQLIQPGEPTPVLGEIKTENDHLIFEPVVPLTRGLRYKVLLDTVLISEIEIPPSESDAPDLLAVYPSQDTVPENLLKMYFQFSQSMTESHSLSLITIMQGDDTLKGTFLDLQPELWNNDGTVLTLWLDPGRIKRDLIPHQEMGTPLKAGEKYTLTVSASWKSKAGIPLKSAYSKTFITGSRDEQMPAINQWGILIPSAGSTQPLTINLKEAMDYSVLMESIEIIHAGKFPVAGKIQLLDEEQTILFTPAENWKTGSYEIRVESRLEDLGGNNLNRPFDRDITKVEKNDQKFFSKPFTIR